MSALRILMFVGLGVAYVAGLALWLIACGVQRARAKEHTLKGEEWDQLDWEGFAFFTTIFQLWIVLGLLWLFLRVGGYLMLTVGERFSKRIEHRGELHKVSLRAANERIAFLEAELANREPFSYRLTSGDKERRDA